MNWRTELINRDHIYEFWWVTECQYCLSLFSFSLQKVRCLRISLSFSIFFYFKRYSISILYLCVTARDIKTPPEINVTLDLNSSFVLNCTYEFESNESVRRVTWRKRHDVNGYKDLAEFTSTEVIMYDHLLKERSQHSPFGQTSKSAILMINEVICEDEGIYECVVLFHQNTSVYTQMISNTTVHIQGKANISQFYKWRIQSWWNHLLLWTYLLVKSL